MSLRIRPQIQAVLWSELTKFFGASWQPPAELCAGFIMGEDLARGAIRQLIAARGTDWHGPVTVRAMQPVNPASSDQDGDYAHHQTGSQSHG